MSMSIRYFSKLVCLLCLLPLSSYAEFAIEDADENGVTNPVDSSWRHYQEMLERFPKRVGFICYNAYLLNKSAIVKDDYLMFLKACADKGSVLSMIFISSHYENGSPSEVNYEESTRWLKRATQTHDPAGYSELAAFHYGNALAKGQGVSKDLAAAREYLQRAVDAGIEGAAEKLAEISL